MDKQRWDFVVVGSGFGGSVSALRLAEKGWRVLVLEKGRRFAPGDFPETNWDLRRWMWGPRLGMQGIFQMSFLRHVTVLHGVGVGGGSLVYANTLPVPKDPFFRAPSWGHLADWKRELAPCYATARRMLGATPNPRWTRGDQVLSEIAKEMGRSEHHHPTDVAVYFGEPGRSVTDPYFGGEGPSRTGCTHCGACMTGCRVGAKNTLDRNYLWLAERRGVTVVPETEVTALRPGKDGYRLEVRPSLRPGRARTITADRVVLAGGVMGTVPLLLAMKEDGLPALSDRVGDFVRTNSEALFGVVSANPEDDFTEGVAITSILHTDEHSHIEPVRYAAGSGFFRLLVAPHAPGETAAERLAGALRMLAADPATWLRAMTVADFARQSQVLLYMRTLEGSLRLRLGRGLHTGLRRGLVSELADPANAPRAFIPEATDLARRFADKVGGVPMNMMTETLLGVPSTAHILGGACMGSDRDEGVIDPWHRVHGYPGLYVVDGAAVSANPGVNPSLTITALAERAMAAIPARA
ncbi:MAG: cholesterol oxidase [Myxococcales bacterium]